MDPKVKIVLNLMRASILLHRIGSKLVEGTGLATVQQWQLLGMVGRNEGMSLSELRKDTLVTKQNMTGMVERLQKGGFVTTWCDPVDRRLTRVGLTPRGKETIRQMQPRSKESNEETFSDFSPEELELFDQLLERLIGSLHDQENMQEERN